MKSVVGMKRKRAPPLARIDRRNTRMSAIEQMLEDSDEGSFCSTTTGTDSESEYHDSEASRSSDSDSDSPAPARAPAPKRAKAGRKGDGDEDDTCAVSSRRRKRSASASVLNDATTSDSSDSDVGTDPVRKASQKKKRLRLSDSEGETGKEREKEAKEAAAKRKERKKKLMELLKKRKAGPPQRMRRTSVSEKAVVAEDKPKDEEEAKDSEDESSEEDTLRLIDSSEEEKEADSDSLKDFIVEDEEQKEKEEEDEEEVVKDKDRDFLSHLPREFITGSQLTHFQVVVKALLINALDTSFLKSLYDGERTKRYAEEMKSSLHHFDERLVLPRLENLKQRSRWKERYKERVECYPKVRVTTVNVLSKGCEACELHRNGRFCVRLSGQLYHNRTLQEDQFMPDDSQMFFVGSVCASRTEVYHALKHFKYHLFERCRSALEDQKEAQQQNQEGDEDEDEPVKDRVNKVFTKLMEEGWITERYDEFQECLNAADFFQEEKLD